MPLLLLSGKAMFKNTDLRLPWMMTGVMALLLLGNACLAYWNSAEWQTHFAVAEVARVNWRTAFYWLAILTLPLTRLIRYIQLRLNQTMPTATPAKSRYCLTVFVSQVLCATISGYGFWLFCAGDGANSLVIFTGMALLGLFLYRPKLAEYQSIVTALAERRG